MESATISKHTLNGVKGIVLSGGPVSIADCQDSGAEYPEIQDIVLDSGLPILGICYGCQILTDFYLGSIKKFAQFGQAPIEILSYVPLFHDMPRRFNAWMSHEDGIDRVWEPKMDVLAETNGHIAAVKVVNEPHYGILWHPEVYHSEHGEKLLANFANKICGMEPNLGNENKIADLKEQIRNRVGKSKVILGISGGVDSAVAAVLLNEAIGDQLHCVFVDHGFHRENEPEELVGQFELLGLKVEHIMARKSFLKKLIGITDAEQKRKIIGNHFVDVFNTVVESIQNEADFLDEEKFKFLAQGTIASDVIESQNIKSHHNVGGLPEDMELEVLEPLRHLFKDEVRALGRALGMPTDIIWRQPVPGPGLAIRVIGEVTKQKLRIVRKADLILREEIKDASISQHHRLWQWFVALLDVNVTGVKGDGRSYEYPVVLRLVRSVDAMTAEAALDLSPLTLRTITSRIVNEVEGVNRVFLDLTDKPSATIEFE